MATNHIDIGVALHPARRGAVKISARICRIFIGVDTTSATIHVAVVGVFARFRVAIVAAANLPVIDVDVGVLQHVAVFATAEHRAFNPGFAAALLADVHLGLLHLGEVGIDGLGSAGNTLGAAIHVAAHAVVVVGGNVTDGDVVLSIATHVDGDVAVGVVVVIFLHIAIDIHTDGA